MVSLLEDLPHILGFGHHHPSPPLFYTLLFTSGFPNCSLMWALLSLLFPGISFTNVLTTPSLYSCIPSCIQISIPVFLWLAFRGIWAVRWYRTPHPHRSIPWGLKVFGCHLKFHKGIIFEFWIGVLSIGLLDLTIATYHILGNFKNRNVSPPRDWKFPQRATDMFQISLFDL